MLFCKQRKIIQIISFFLVLASCKTVEKKDVVINEPAAEQEVLPQKQSHQYKLKKYQDYEFEEKFKSMVDRVYTETLSQYDLNFTYSIEPEGAVYPFSEVSVSCITDKKISNLKKDKVCSDFLNSLDREYDTLKGEIK